jgi:hypothetical protein
LRKEDTGLAWKVDASCSQAGRGVVVEVVGGGMERREINPGGRRVLAKYRDSGVFAPSQSALGFHPRIGKEPKDSEPGIHF